MPIWRNGTGNGLWGTAGNWIADGSGSGVPTALTDATFDNLSPSCTVNVAGVCRNLNFTGYTNTITMSNNITVGSTANTTPASLVLSSTMNVSGSGSLLTRTNSSSTLTSNGFVWPNSFGIGTVTTGVLISTFTFTDNWTINGTLTIGTGGACVFTFSGAFNLRCNGNLAIAISGSSATTGIRSTANVTTIVIGGNTSWTSIAPVNIGINVNINAPGNTVTIGDNCSYGGLATPAAGASFTYTAGTVTTSGTFHLLLTAAASNYTLNVNGDSSPSATTTNTSGVNFSNLSLRTNALSNPQSCVLSSPICVVNDFFITSHAGVTKGVANLLNNTAYLNKSVILNGYSGNGTTIFRLQGTGTWSENNTLSAGATGFGLSNPIVINTTGTITLTSFVGLRNNTITYTAGSFVTTGFGFRVLASGFSGFGSGGILIETLWHTSAGPTSTASSNLSINDTQPLLITNLNFDGFNINNGHRYLGTAGWTCANFNYQQTATVTNADIGFTATSGLAYTITNSFICRAYSSTASSIFKIAGAAARVNFILKFGASQDVFRVGTLDIDSSAEQTIWTRKGSLFNTLNWNLWTFPRTRFSSSIG